MILTACSGKIVERTRYQVLIFEPPSYLLEERVVETGTLKTNRDLVELIARYRLQLDLSNDDKKVLKSYMEKQHEDKVKIESQNSEN